MIPFETRLKELLQKEGVSLNRMEIDTGISRTSFAPSRTKGHNHKPSTYMAIAYYLDMSVEDLVSGTDAEETWGNR